MKKLHRIMVMDTELLGLSMFEDKKDNLLLFKRSQGLAFAVKPGHGGYSKIRDFYKSTDMNIAEFNVDSSIFDQEKVSFEFQKFVDDILFNYDENSETVILVDNFDSGMSDIELYRVLASASLYENVHFVLVGTKRITEMFR